MIVHTEIASLRRALELVRNNGSRVGFVPTMGALHGGHVSLLDRSVSENDVSVASVFVNPLQFNESEDLTDYPRDLEGDCKVAEAAGLDHVFAPSVAEMYPSGCPTTKVSVAGLADKLEGALRPGHFDGVATVVTKLLSIVGPCRSYFGEKDWQQLAVVRRMAADLSLPVEVVGCPIVRDSDGLAMSSRNAYLNEPQRKAATVLYTALKHGVELVDEGVNDAHAVRNGMLEILADEPLCQPDYAAVVDDDFDSVDEISTDVRLLVAARVGSTRLIDNCGLMG